MWTSLSKVTSNHPSLTNSLLLVDKNIPTHKSYKANHQQQNNTHQKTLLTTP